MNTNNERRREKRLRYHWPVWFAEDAGGELNQGQMVDVSSGGAAFTCCRDERDYWDGQNVTTRFSVPCFTEEEDFNLKDFVRAGHICRVEKVNEFTRRIAVQFAEPLPFKPGEQHDGYKMSSRDVLVV